MNLRASNDARPYRCLLNLVMITLILSLAYLFKPSDELLVRFDIGHGTMDQFKVFLEVKLSSEEQSNQSILLKAKDACIE